MLLMVSACTLVCCKGGESGAVLERIKGIDGVQRAFRVLGRWDIIVEVEVADMEALKRTCLSVNGLEGVRATETLVGA